MIDPPQPGTIRQGEPPMRKFINFTHATLDGYIDDPTSEITGAQPASGIVALWCGTRR